MHSVDMIVELLKENKCSFNKSNCVFNSGDSILWKFKVISETGNIMYILLENNIINFQVNSDLWRTYSLEDPNSLSKVIEALEVSLAL